MRRLSVSLFLAYLLVVPLVGERVRVASYNLNNYLIVNRYYDGAYRLDYPKPEKQKAALRRQIIRGRPDVLAVQEIGGEPFLKELARDLKREGLDYPYTVLFRHEDEPRCLAVMSRLPIVDYTQHGQLTFNYFGKSEEVKRGLLELKFETNGVAWSVYNLHLKSRREVIKDDPNSNLRRSKEARVIRDFIRRKSNADQKEKFLVLGDYNDYVSSASLKRFLEISGKPFLLEIPATDENGECWTYFNRYNRVYEQVDFLIASPALKPHVLDNRATILGGPDAYEASDHRLVYLDLEF